MPPKGRSSVGGRSSGSTLRKRQRAKDDGIYEDLDLDVADASYGNRRDDDVEDHVLKNARGADVGSDDDLDVGPQDAHFVPPKDAKAKRGKKKLSAKQQENAEYAGVDAAVEEGELAIRTDRKLTRGLRDDDFNVGLFDSLPPPRKAAKKKSGDDDDDEDLSSSAAAAVMTSRVEATNQVVEKVERDFLNLAQDERFALIKQESPEVERLLEEFNSSLKEVSGLAGPVRERLFHQTKRVRQIGGVEEKQLLHFLETKVQLLLSYCIHITFYLLLKVEGQKVKGHPVVDRLVEIRTYLEKLWPIEQKLSYSISKLMSGTAADKPSTAKLRPIVDSDDGVFRANKTYGRVSEHKERRKAEAVAREAAEVEREEERTMSRVRQRKGVVERQEAAMKALAPVGQEEAVDAGRHFLAPAEEEDSDDDNNARLFGGGGRRDEDDEDAGLSLIEKLKMRKQKKDDSRPAPAAPQPRKAKRSGGDDDDDGAFGEDDGEFDDDEGGSEFDYDDLVAEENQRTVAAKDKRALQDEEIARMQKFSEGQSGDRRIITDQIKSHRGLTKTRNKETKTPRTAKKQRYKTGLAKANAQSRTAHQAESDHKGRIMTHVTHSRGLA